MKILKTILLALLMCNALSGQTKQDKKTADAQAYLNLRELITEGIIVFSADWATTQQGNRINLTGNPNSVKISKEKIVADLPFFGITQVPSTDGRGGIYFEQENPEIKTTFNDKKQRVELKFTGKNRLESMSCTLIIFKNKNARLQVFSSNRNTITYDGRIQKTESVTEK